MRTHRLLPLILAAAPSTSVDAGSPAAFSKDKKPGQALPFRAVGTWGVAAAGRKTTVHWECDSLRHEADDDTVADVRLSLVAERGSGPVSAEVLSGTDATNIAKHRDSAHVSAGVAGAGVAYFKIALDIEGDNLPAGDYGSTVQVTVGSL